MGKNKGIGALIFLFLGITLMFVKTWLGLVCTVIAFIISLANFKNRNTLLTITLVSSIIIMCIQAVLIAFAYVTVKETYDNAKNTTHKLFEQRFEDKTKEYALTEELFGRIDFSQNPTLVVSLEDVNLSYEGCTGYAIYDSTTEEAQAYLNCSDYTTDGYDNSYQK